MNSTAWRSTGNDNELRFTGDGGGRGGFVWFSSRPWRGNQRFAGSADVLYATAHSGARLGLSEPINQTPDDVSLLRLIADGDPEALRQLYQRHSGLLFSLALKTLADQSEAEDVLQEAFVQVWKSAGRYDPKRSQPVGWLILLVRSRAIDRLRSRQSRSRTSEAFGLEPVAAPPLPAQVADTAETHTIVRQAVRTLPAEQRTLIEMAYFGGFSQTEIAAKLGEPLGTVKTRIRAGMTRLREQLAKAGGRR